jgi:O-antigen/teichoic acid export membrane protein
MLPEAWGEHTWLLVWVPLIAGLMGGFAVLNQFAVRHRAYTAIARRNVLMASSVVVLQVLAGVLGAGPHGLAAGLAGGQAIGLVAMVRSLRPYLHGPSPSASERRATWREFRSFPLLLAPSGVVNVLGLSIPIMLAASLYGEKVSGWLGMTQRVLTVPVTLVGLALAQVYLGEFSRVKRGSSAGLERIFLQTTRRLGAVAVLLTIAVVAASEFVFPLVLGPAWARSGDYAMLLALAMGAQLCASPLSQTVVVLGRPAFQAGWDVSRLILCGGSIVVAHRLGWDDLGAVGLLSAMMTATYALSWVLSWWAVRRGPTGVSSRASAPVPS